MKTKTRTFFTRSWKTTACGIAIGTGQFLVLAPMAHLRGVGPWVGGDNRHAYMVAGVFITVIASILLGVASRDHDVSSEQAGSP